MRPHDSGLRSIRAGLAILAAVCFVSLKCPTNATLTRPRGTETIVSDPGPRGGPPAAGGPVAGLSNIATWYAAFNAGAATFQEVEDVAHSGLGPRFNSNSCVSCHAQPAAGGTSPASNPQVQFANSQNKLPVFHSVERAGARGAFREEPGWHAGWRSSRALHHRRPSRPTIRLQSGPGGLLSNCPTSFSGFPRRHSDWD